MIVVTDASPIIALSAVGQLELLRRLYGKIFIPASVAGEIAAGAQDSQLPPRRSAGSR